MMNDKEAREYIKEELGATGGETIPQILAEIIKRTNWKFK